MTGSAQPQAARGPDEARTSVVVVELHGELDGAARAGLDVLLDGLEQLPCPIVLDVSAARSRTGAGLRRLCRFRAARHGEGLECRLQGLHAGFEAHLATADLSQVFAVWADTHRTGPTS